MAHHDRQRLRVADFLERVRDELDRTRQDASLWREETDRERARIANLQADTEHTELTLTHILLGELKVIGWNLSGRFWRAPHPSKA